ncbi:MAG: hypothetical protein RMJ05_07940 [Thermomicrobium sp.]|nr:hypothetical protein [Thermomicrobium sp.]MDW8006638.1 hypothetical protein [Thermomicrobium sp.]
MTTWDISAAEQAARNLATLLHAAVDDEQAAQFVADYQALLAHQPAVVRAAFINTFASTASPKALERFLRLTAVERDEEGDQR